MYQVVFVAGMSRAGSMWAYNVTRRLISESGRIPLPEKIPVDEQQAIREAMHTPPGENGVYCFKTHRRIDPITPDMRIICPYRDVRDAMYSYMKFMKCTFDRALMAARGMMDNTDHYLQRNAANILPLRYDQIVGTPAAAVARIAEFLNLQVTDAAVQEIAADFSRQKMRKYLKTLDAVKVDDTGKLQSAAQAERYAAIPRFDGSHRIYDHSTGFQSNHITTGKDGQWRKKFTPPQQQALMQLTAPWLNRYGFKL